MLIHIVVGDARHTPTEDELTEIVRRYQTEKVFVNSAHTKVLFADINALHENPEAQYTVIVTAGDKHWTPSPQELDSLRTQFTAALKDPKGSIVSTRHSVRVEILVESLTSNPIVPVAPYKIKPR